MKPKHEVRGSEGPFVAEQVRQLVEALESCCAVMGEAGSDEHVKQLTDLELGKLWTATQEKARAALAPFQQEAKR